MTIGGMQTLTLLDYPEHVAATIFTVGCNFRCPFCHNGDLVLQGSEEYKEEEVLQFLKKRRNVTEAVCITGGEPTLMKDLPVFIYRIKNMGYLVKLDTNGTNPEMIQKLYEGNLIDYVAMDIKNSFENYERTIGGVNTDMNRIKSSIEYIMKSGVDYEFRTTLVKGIHIYEDMEKMAEAISGAKKYVLQNYAGNDKTIARLTKNEDCFEPFSGSEMNHFLEIAQKYVINARLRLAE